MLTLTCTYEYALYMDLFICLHKQIGITFYKPNDKSFNAN